MVDLVLLAIEISGVFNLDLGTFLFGKFEIVITEGKFSQAGIVNARTTQ